MKNFVCNSESDTAELGRAIGRCLQPGTVVGLNGTLGAGKTRLTQSIGIGLDIDSDVVSPTFTIAVPHEGRLALLHLDAYRIGQPEEIDELGLDELTENGVVLVVEWAETILEFLPPLDLAINIEPTGADTRLIHFQSFTEVGTKLLESISQRLNPTPSD